MNLLLMKIVLCVSVGIATTAAKNERCVPAQDTGTAREISNSTAMVISQGSAPVVVKKSREPKALPKVFQFILEQTNIIRKHHKAPPLKWNHKLEDSIYKQASKCEKTVEDPHVVAEGFSSAQNWAPGSPCESGSSLNCRVKQDSAPWRWYEREQPRWNFATRTCSGKWDECGHFVVQVQPAAAEMGCAVVECSSLGGVSLYCDYIGKFEESPFIFPNANNRGLQVKLLRHYSDFVSKNY